MQAWTAAAAAVAAVAAAATAAAAYAAAALCPGESQNINLAHTGEITLGGINVKFSC